MLLSDTVQCPSCRHVLDPDRAAEIPASAPVAKSAEPMPEEPCPSCGSPVREGLVRCWNCGTFMREEIAESYQRMKSKPADIIYSQLPDVDEEDAPVYEYEGEFDDGDEGDDFELAPEISADDHGAFETETGDETLADQDVQQDVYDIAQDGSSKSGGLSEPTSEPQGGSTDTETTGVDTSKEPAATDQTGVETADTAQEANSTEDDESGESHSVATGGQVLLQVALAEEAEKGKRRAERGGRGGEAGAAMSGFLVFCPNGHRLEVQERHRGKKGRCPVCSSPFFVPAMEWDDVDAAMVKSKKEKEADALTAQQESEQLSAGAFVHWMKDVHFHTVDPAKLKIKPGSLQKVFEVYDFAFAPFGVLMMSVAQKGSLFGASKTKKEPAAIREEIRVHLDDEKPIDELPVPWHRLIDSDTIQAIRVVQPAPSEYESMFAGVPVFGEGRIAVRFAKEEEETEQKFASFSLTEFRRFVEIVREIYGIEDFAADVEVPLSNMYSEYKCHYNDVPVKALDNTAYYLADDKFELKIGGRRCQACGLVVCEDARKKEKIGGASGKGIARAKCPGCKKKFGNITLHHLAEDAESLAIDAGNQAASASTAG